MEVFKISFIGGGVGWCCGFEKNWFKKWENDFKDKDNMFCPQYIVFQLKQWLTYILLAVRELPGRPH